jgi:hypothetical protein
VIKIEEESSMSQAAELMELAARCFDQARAEKNPVAAATLVEIGVQYVRRARELRMAEKPAVESQNP